MAEREDIRERIRQLNPKALAVMDEIDRQLVSRGWRYCNRYRGHDAGRKGDGRVRGVERGYQPDVAEAKAKEFLSCMDGV